MSTQPDFGVRQAASPMLHPDRVNASTFILICCSSERTAPLNGEQPEPATRTIISTSDGVGGVQFIYSSPVRARRSSLVESSTAMVVSHTSPLYIFPICTSFVTTVLCRG